MAATVTSIRPYKWLPAPARVPTCVVCGVADPNMSRWSCDSCKAWMHRECYWGRVASLDEWRSYVKWNIDTDAEIIRTPWEVPSLCPACRAKEGA
jgi:hypothetical protein